MSKKKLEKRPNVSNEALERARRELYGTDAPTITVEGQRVGEGNAPVRSAKKDYVVSSVKQTMTRDELALEYGYVIKDLRNMALLALILFVGMVAVSLVLSS